MVRRAGAVLFALGAAVFAASCGVVPAATPVPTMSDAARVWCADNDSYNRGFGDALSGSNRVDLVAPAAVKLGLTVPKAILDMGEAWATSELSNWTVFLPEDVTSAYQAALPAWRASPEYARACQAAFESR